MSVVKVLNQREVAERIGVSSMTFRKHYYDHKTNQGFGGFPSKKVFGRGHIGWLSKDIDDYMLSCTSEDI